MRRKISLVLAFSLIFSFRSATANAWTLTPTNNSAPYEVATYQKENIFPQPSLCGFSGSSQYQGYSIYFLLDATPLKNDLGTKPSSYQITAIAFYFDGSGSPDFSEVRVSIYETKLASDAPTTASCAYRQGEPGQGVIEDLKFDPIRSSLFSSGSSKIYEVIFPFRTENFAFDKNPLESCRRFVAVLKCPSSSPNGKDLKIYTTELKKGAGQYNYVNFNGAVPVVIKPSPEKRLAFTLFSGRPAAVSNHPVVLIRGEGGLTSDWDDLVSTLNFYEKPEYINRFDYDETQSLVSNAQTLKSLVAELSQKYWNDWGDGKVDLVGFSLGGLIAHRYLIDNKESHNIRRFVAVATPFKGTPWVDFESQAAMVARVGKWLKKKFPDGLTPLIGAKKTLVKTQMAVTEMKNDISGENGLPNSQISYYTLYGKTPVEYRQNLFGRTVKKKEDLGDLYVSPESAEALNVASLEKFSFAGGGGTEKIFNASLLVGSEGAEVEFVGPELNEVTYRHDNFLSRPAILVKIKEILQL